MAHTSVWWQTRWQLCKYVTIRLSHKAKVRLVAVSTLQVSNLRALDSLRFAQSRMSEHADQARRDEQFAAGEFVLLSTKFHLGRKKLMGKYLGPFEILARKGAVAYELRLPASMSRMFPVFHVSLLKRYKDGCRGAAPPPAVLDDGETECEIDKILAHRDFKTGRRSYYVQWKGLPPEENEWLTASKLRNAADVVQDYLDELHNKDRQAGRVGRPDGDAAQPNDSQVVTDSTTNNQSAAAQPKRRRGCPRKTGAVGNKAVQKRGRGRPRKKS